MKKNNHHHTGKPLKVGDVVSIHHNWEHTIEIIIGEYEGAWKTYCIYASESRFEWEGKTFTLEKESERVFTCKHSRLLRILYGYE